MALIISQTSSGYYAYNYNGVAQTFTMPTGYDLLEAAEVCMYRTATVGTITVGIKATSGGVPTGSFLTSVSISGASVTTSSAGSYVWCDFGNIAVTPGSQYALCIEGYNSSSLVFKFAGNVSGGASVYGGGNPFYKPTSSSYATWGSDMAFQVYATQNTTTPTVTTGSITNVTQTSATLSGNVTSDGGSAVTSRGVCWNVAPDPTTANNNITAGTGTGAFSGTYSSFPPNTLHYARAFATNANGTVYGSNVSFRTLEEDNITFSIDDIYIEVFYEEIPTSQASPTSSVVGDITNEMEYKLTLGDVDFEGEVLPGVEVVLDLGETLARGEPVWFLDTGKECTQRVSWTDSTGRDRTIYSIDGTQTCFEDYIGYDDSDAAIKTDWRSQDFFIGDDMEEYALQSIFLQYKPSTAGDIPVDVYIRSELGAWELQSNAILPASSKNFAQKKIEPKKAVKGRMFAIRLVSQDSKELEVYRVSVLYATNKATQRD